MLDEQQQKKLMSWISAEINLCEDVISKTNRYVKTRHVGYQQALKKVQARLDGHFLD